MSNTEGWIMEAMVNISSLPLLAPYTFPFCSRGFLHRLQCGLLLHCSLLHRLQRNLYSGTWRTSTLSFSNLGVHRDVSHTFFPLTTLCHEVLCPFLIMFSPSCLAVDTEVRNGRSKKAYPPDKQNWPTGSIRLGEG